MVTGTRFRRQHDDLALVAAVQTALAAHGDRLTHAVFDGMRGSGIPTARSICRRLGMTWSEVITIAGDDTREAGRSLATRRRATVDKGLDREEIRWALLTVVAALGVNQLRPDEYERERVRLHRAQRRAWMHGRVAARLLPTRGQIERVLSWDEALAVAGLAARMPNSGTKGYPLSEAVDLFLEENGCLPSTRVLRAWAREKRLSIEGGGLGSIPAIIPALAARRAGEGKWTPMRSATKTQRPPVILASSDPALPLGRRSWTFEECQDAIARALTRLPPDAALLDQKTYRAIAEADPHMPSASVIGDQARKHGTTFTAMRQQAM